jgi:CRP-like cAMP-binding protein
VAAQTEEVAVAQLGSWSARATARQDFSPFNSTDIAHIKAAAVEQYIEPGTRLLAAGERVDRVMVVGSGEVELSAHTPGGRRVMAVVRKGGVMGDIPLFLEIPMPYDAVVSRRALVCELDRKALLAFLTSAPSASLRWMRSIALRFEDDRRRLLAVLTSDLTAQVAFLLLEHAEPGTGGKPVVHLSHEVIAQLLGARRQSVSRVIADLRERGVLSTAYREIVLDDPDALQDVAGPSLPAWPH